MDKKWFGRLLITLVTALPSVQAEALFPEQIDARMSGFFVVVVPNARRFVGSGNAALYLDDCKIGSIFSAGSRHLRFLY